MVSFEYGSINTLIALLKKSTQKKLSDLDEI